MDFWNQIDPLNDMIVWFLYNFVGTSPCLVALLLAKYSRGKWGWQIWTAIGLVHRIYLFFGAVLHLFLNFDSYLLYYHTGEELFVIPYAIFYHIQIKCAINERQPEEGGNTV